MSDFEFLHESRIHLIWLAIGLIILFAWLELRGRDALQRYVSRHMQMRLARQLTPARRILSLGFVFATLCFCIVVLMRPQTIDSDRTTKDEMAADIIVVLDLSRSMLATDAAPTRLDRAKAEIRDMLPQLEGSQVGLVGFAGSAKVLCPLTPDLNYFNLVLESADIHTIGRGGTHIGAGLREAIDAFADEGENRARVVFLITDGEDHESYPRDAAKAAAAQGIRVIAIGFGDEDGSPIEVENTRTGELEKVVDSDGNVVISKLDGELLRDMAVETGGVFIPAGVAVLDLDSIIADHIEPLLEEPAEVEVRETRVELYPWFLLGALLSLAGAVLVRSRWLAAGAGLDAQPASAEVHS